MPYDVLCLCVCVLSRSFRGSTESSILGSLGEAKRKQREHGFVLDPTPLKGSNFMHKHTEPINCSDMCFFFLLVTLTRQITVKKVICFRLLCCADVRWRTKYQQFIYLFYLFLFSLFTLLYTRVLPLSGTQLLFKGLMLKYYCCTAVRSTIKSK